MKEVKNRAKTRIRLEEKDRNILEKSTLRKIIEGEYFETLDDAGKKLYQEMLENFLALISEESVVKMLKDDSLDKAKKASILKDVVGSFADKNFQNYAETVFLNNLVLQ